MKKLKHLCQLMTSLVPVARQAALAYNLLCQIGKTSPHSALSWPRFSHLYSRCLEEFKQSRRGGGADVSTAVLGGGQQAVEVVDSLTTHFSKTLLQHAFR